MSRLESTFSALKSSGRKAYVGYVMAGYPDEAGSLALARGLLNAGADLLEVGVPFSDPIADGPVIQRCAEMSLKAGGSMSMAMSILETLRGEFPDRPLLLMTYLNPVLARGMDNFAAALKAAGGDGVIVPDLTPEESKGPKAALEAEGLSLIFLAAPTSTPARLKKVAKAAGGFIYVVSVAGVTGERAAFDSRLGGTIKELRKHTRLPLCVGFGVSSPQTAREAASQADGVVVASTVLKEMGNAGLEPALARAAELIQAAHSAAGA